MNPKDPQDLDRLLAHGRIAGPRLDAVWDKVARQVAAEPQESKSAARWWWALGPLLAGAAALVFIVRVPTADSPGSVSEGVAAKRAGPAPAAAAPEAVEARPEPSAVARAPSKAAADVSAPKAESLRPIPTSLAFDASCGTGATPCRVGQRIMLRVQNPQLQGTIYVAVVKGGNRQFSALPIPVSPMVLLPKDVLPLEADIRDGFDLQVWHEATPVPPDGFPTLLERRSPNSTLHITVSR